jgi:hypothetical protein
MYSIGWSSPKLQQYIAEDKSYIEDWEADYVAQVARLIGMLAFSTYVD